MKNFFVVLSLLLLCGCASSYRYRDYSYAIVPVSKDVSYIWVVFWGEQFVPGWKEKAIQAGRQMIEYEAAQHHLTGKIGIVIEPEPSEGGGISVQGFIGDDHAYTPEEARQIQTTINFKWPYTRGKGKLSKTK